MIETMCKDLAPQELNAMKGMLESLSELFAETEHIPANAPQLIAEFALLEPPARNLVMEDIDEQQSLYSALSELYDGDDEMVNNIVSAAPAMMDPLLSLIPDENAVSMPAFFPEWVGGMLYSVGFRVRYNEILYSCVQLHASQQGWEPPTVPALWRRISEPGTIPEWVQPTGAQDAYNIGDKVSHNDKIWESLVDANVWEPGSIGSDNLWKEVETDEGE